MIYFPPQGIYLGEERGEASERASSARNAGNKGKWNTYRKNVWKNGVNFNLPHPNPQKFVVSSPCTQSRWFLLLMMFKFNVFYDATYTLTTVISR